MIRDTTQINKIIQDIPVGISRIELKDPWRQVRIAYQALVKHNGKFKTKRFYVSGKRNEVETYKIALACRQAYEQCENMGLPFDLDRWSL